MRCQMSTVGRRRMASPSRSPGSGAERASPRSLEDISNGSPAREHSPRPTPARRRPGRPKKRPPSSVQQPSDAIGGSCATSSLRAALLIRRSARSAVQPSEALATIQPRRKRRRSDETSAADLASPGGPPVQRVSASAHSSAPSRDLGLLLELQREKKAAEAKVCEVQRVYEVEHQWRLSAERKARHQAEVARKAMQLYRRTLRALRKLQAAVGCDVSDKEEAAEKRDADAAMAGDAPAEAADARASEDEDGDEGSSGAVGGEAGNDGKDVVEETARAAEEAAEPVASDDTPSAAQAGPLQALPPRTRSRTAEKVAASLLKFERQGIAQLLGAIARRTRCTDEVLAVGAMRHAVKRHDVALLKDVRRHWCEGENSPFGAKSWCRLKHVLHLSYRKVKFMGYHLSNTRVPASRKTDVCAECDGNEDEEAVRTVLVPNLLHPDFPEVTMRVVPLERHLTAEDERLRQGECAMPMGQGKTGASMSFIKSLLSIINTSKGANRMTTDGRTRERALRVLVAGDGFQISGKKKAVRVGVALVSTTGLNQSPHDWIDFLMFNGKEDYEEIRAYFDDVAAEVRDVGAKGYVEDSEGTRYYIDLIIGGDKPWMLAFLGHRNMNFTFPFPYCKCRQGSEANTFTHDPFTHLVITAADACRLTHTSPEVHFYCAEGEATPFRCPAEERCRRGVWCNSDGTVDATAIARFKDHLARLTDSQRQAELEAFSHSHYGFNFDTPPLMPYLMVAPDPLHAYLNIFAAVFKFAVWNVLAPTENASPGVNAVKVLARGIINDLSRPMGIEFAPEKMPKLNGNTVKAMLATPGYLSGVVRAMAPVYNSGVPESKEPVAAAANGNKRRGQGVRLSVSASTARGNREAATSSANFASQQQPAAAEPTLRQVRQDVRLACVFESAFTHWGYIAFKGYDAEDAAVRRERSLQLHVLGKELAGATIDLLGKERQCTYLHDLVYAFPNLMLSVGHVLRVSMEGFEHGNKVTKAIFRDEVSKGGKKRKSDGKRKDEFMQLIERRRESTVAANEYGQINQSAAAKELTQQDAQYNRFYKVEEAKTELQELRSEILQLQPLSAASAAVPAAASSVPPQ